MHSLARCLLLLAASAGLAAQTRVPPVQLDAPTQLVRSVPENGQANVQLSQRVSLIFSRSLLPASIGGLAVFAQDENLNVIPDQRTLSKEGTTLFMTFPSLLPVDQLVRVWIDGDLLLDIHGIRVDADGDGVAGGRRAIGFRTVPGAQRVENPQPAVILGTVFDSSTPPRPLAGAIVRAWTFPRDERLPPLPVPDAISNAQGEFVYRTPPFVGGESFLLEIKKPGHSEALRDVRVSAGGCWRVDDARLMPVTPPIPVSAAQGATLPDPANPAVRLIIPGGALQRNSDVGVTLLRGSTFLREQLPSRVAEGGAFVDVAGVFGEATNSNVTLEVPNTYNLLVGTQVPFGKVDHNTLEWVDLRDISQTATIGVVRARGASTFIEVQFDRFCSICTGYCLPNYPNPDTSNGSGGNDSGNPGCDGPGTSSGNSVISLREGHLEEFIELPVLREMGGAFGLTLGYASNSASPNVTLNATTNYNSTRPVEATIYKFQIEGVTAEAVYDRTSNNQKPTGTFFWNGRDGLGARVRTGSYPYAVQATSLNANAQVSIPARFGGAGTQFFSGTYPGLVPLRSQRITGRTVLVNQVSSPFGAGWSLLQQPRLHFDADGGAVLTFGNSDYLRFAPNPGNANQFLSPPGDFSTLTYQPANGGFRRSFRDGARHEFDSGGSIQRMIDRYGHETTFTYAGGLLSAIASPTGYRFNLQYSGAGKLTQITDSANRVTRFVVDGAGDLVQVTDAEGAVRRFLYDSEHRLIAQFGSRSERTEYGYTNGRVVSASAFDTDGQTMLRERRFAPSALNGEIAEALRRGQGLPANPIPVFQGRIDRMTDGLGATSLRETNDLGQTIMAQDGLNRVTRYGFSAPGHVSSRTRPNLAVTEYRYDTFGNLSAIRELSNSVTLYATTSFEYNGPFDLLSRLVDPESKQTQFGYDALGNLTTVTNHDGHVTRFFYEDTRFRSQPTRLVLPTGDTIVLAYDSRGNIQRATDFPNPATNPAGRTTTFAYDAAGNPVAVTDPRPQTTGYTYDNLGRVRTMIDALLRTTTFDYSDAACNCSTAYLGRVTFANNTSLAYRYDGLGRLRSRTDQRGMISRYTWDAEANLLTSTNRNNDTIAYEWDLAGQLLRKTLPGNIATTYTYDVEGNVTSLVDAACRLTFQYDFLNRATQATSVIQLALGQGPPVPVQHRVNYTYDRVGSRLTMADDWNLSSHVWTYDNQHRPATLSLPLASNQRWTFGYDASGRRTSLMPLPSGARTNYVYDLAGQVTTIDHLTTPPLTLDYTQFDGVGNLLQHTRRTGGQTLTSTYGYDPLSQLQSAGFSQQFGDARVARNYAYDAANRLVVDQDYTYGYDDEGRLIGRLKNGTSTVELLNYDAEGQLRRYQQVFDNQGTPTVAVDVTYAYDPLGRRVEKVVNGVPKRFVYDGMDILYELDGQNRLERAYTHGPGVDEPFAAQDNVTSGFLGFHADRLGSIVGLVDGAGSLVREHVFEEFGLPIALRSGGSLQAFGFTGREMDLESGLMLYRARHLDVERGRFTSGDRLGLQSGLNFYAYVANNPTNATDPTGDLVWWLIPIVGGLVGGGTDLGLQLLNNGGDLACVDWGSVGLSAGLGALFSSTGPSGVLFGKGHSLAGGGIRGLLNRGSRPLGWSYNKARDRLYFSWRPFGGGRGNPHLDLIPGPRARGAGGAFGLGGGAAGGGLGGGGSSGCGCRQ